MVNARTDTYAHWVAWPRLFAAMHYAMCDRERVGQNMAARGRGHATRPPVAPARSPA